VVASGYKIAEYIACSSNSADVGLGMAATVRTQNELICVFLLSIGAGTVNAVIENSRQLRNS